MIEVTAAADADEIDVDNRVDPITGVRYIGTAKRFSGDQWRCLAQIGNALCLVEVTVRAAVVIDHDRGDEDDREAKRRRLARDLYR